MAKKNKEIVQVQYETIPLEELKKLDVGTVCYIFAIPSPRSLLKDGKFYRVRINGKPKTWVTRPNDVQVPWKYGMYEYGKSGFINGHAIGHILMRPIKNVSILATPTSLQLGTIEHA